MMSYHTPYLGVDSCFDPYLGFILVLAVDVNAVSKADAEDSFPSDEVHCQYHNVPPRSPLS